MEIISLTKGKIAFIDECDLPIVDGIRWYASRSDKRWYAKSKGRYLHRLILNVPAGFEVDHINGNSLDNRRLNLRLCTHQQNTFNQKKRHPESGYIGVRKYKKKWWARVMLNGKNINKGSFLTAIEAAKAHDELAKKHHGEFAKLNF